MFDLQKIRKIINWYIFKEYGKNDAEIAAKLGYTKSSFSQILRGKVPVSQNFIDKLCSLDANINKVWIAGDGEMFKQTTYDVPILKNIQSNNEEGMKCRVCEEKDKRIDDLKKQIENLEKHVGDLNKHIENFAIEIKKPLGENTRGSDYTKDSIIIIPQQHQKEKNRL